MSTKEQAVIRYSKEVMIALHDSPLVQKPESMPSLLVWFGEDPDSPTCKNILNGAYLTRHSSDRGIILGPTKTNFASSLYGGLKKSDDIISKSTTHNTRHNNNRQLDGIRSPRGPSFMGEKGFSHRIDNKSMKYGNDKRRSNRSKQQQQQQQQQQDSDSSVPEWMDYTPEIEQEQVTNDLEVWKSNMKKRDGIQIEKVEESLSQLSIEQQFFPNEERRDQKGSSRFAKFFAKRENTTAIIEPNQGRSISVADLFNQQVNKDKQDQSIPSQRVFSEEDVLKSLGQKKNTIEPNNEDVIGFDRVRQILSQPKPMPPVNNNNTPQSPIMTGSPMEKNRFGNNLPTSVLRQMSTRSKSPSLKSNPPTQHHFQQVPLPPHYMAYPPIYSPGHPAMMDPRAFEQFVHGIPPPPPPPHMMMMPPLPPGQRPIMNPPPPHFMQTQRFPQQQQQQMPHHMTNGIPPPPQLFNKWEQHQ